MIMMKRRRSGRPRRAFDEDFPSPACLPLVLLLFLGDLSDRLGGAGGFHGARFRELKAMVFANSGSFDTCGEKGAQVSE